MSDSKTSGSDQIPEWAIICSACGEAHHYDARGTQCNACGAFLPDATEDQHDAFTQWYVERCEAYERGDLELRADGGTSEYDYAAAKERGYQWLDRAEGNVDRWGNQTPAVLLLALAEEIGEVADEVLATGEKPLHDPMYSAEGIHLLSEVRRAGFACRDFLEEHFEDEDGAPLPEEEMPRIFHDLNEARVLDEVDDAAPLLFQLSWALNSRSRDTDREHAGGPE